MAIRIADKEINMVYYGNVALKAVYRGVHLIWTQVVAIISCFGTGKWLGDKPWIGEDKWKGNP